MIFYLYVLYLIILDENNEIPFGHLVNRSKQNDRTSSVEFTRNPNIKQHKLTFI